MSPARRAGLLAAAGVATVALGVTAVAGGWVGRGEPAAAEAPAVAAPATVPTPAPAPSAPPQAPVVAVPPPAPVALDRPPAVDVAAAVAEATRDVGVAPPRLTPLPLPGYAHAPAAASSLTALHAPLAVSASPGGPAVRSLTDPTRKGAPLVLGVLDHRPGWTEVGLPEKPNGLAGWVRDTDVLESASPWRVQVLKGRHRILVWYGTSLVLDQPVAVGADGTPTPVGTFAIDVIVERPDIDGPYGQWIMGISAHSDAFETFGGGEPLIGMHGTNEPESIGHSVSNGCIRMQRPVAALLAHLLPLGTQVRILA